MPHGTVAAIQDPRRPGFHIPCVWMVAGKQEQSQPSILVPQDVEGEPVDVADGGPADGGPELCGYPGTSWLEEPGWFRHEFGMGHIPRIGN